MSAPSSRAGSDEGSVGDRDVDGLGDLTFRDFVLGRDGDLVLAALHSRLTSANQLRGAQAGQHGKLKRSDAGWPPNHARLDGLHGTIGNVKDIGALTGKLW
jgi:hypothetical protein